MTIKIEWIIKLLLIAKEERMKRVLISSALLVSIGLSVLTWGFPIIVEVVETGGDNEPTDTVTAKWTGVTFVNGVANEPIPNTPADAPYTVGFFQDLAPAMVDRNHRYTGAASNIPIPPYLLGGEYIMIGNDNRDNPELRLDITVIQPVAVYLLIDNRMGDGNNANPPSFETAMRWVVTEGFVPMCTGINRQFNPNLPDEIGIDESADGSINQWFSIYWKIYPAGTFTLYEQNYGGINIYGVVVQPAPDKPIISVSQVTGVGFQLSASWTSDLTITAASLDGNPIVGQIFQGAGLLRFVYTLPKPQMFPPGSTHTLEIELKDASGKTYQWSDTIKVPAYPMLPEEWALSSASGAGMVAGVYMMEGGTRGNSLAEAEQQWARGIINPATGQAYGNMISPETYEISYVNWGQIGDYWTDIDSTPADGPDHFNSVLPVDLPIENDPIPGTEALWMSGVTSFDYIVSEVTCFLYLEPGYYRMGVNSDDGFRVSVAAGQPDVFGITLGLYDGGRGAADTIFDFGVSKAGYYPFRLLWWEGTGAASCEWFTIDPYTGEYLLINGPQAGAIKAYKSSTENRAHVKKMLPAAGLSTLIEAGLKFEWVLEDGNATTVDTSKIQVVWREKPVQGLNITRSGKLVNVSFVLKPEDVDYGLRTESCTFIWGESNGVMWTNSFTYRVLKDWKEGEIQARLIANVVETGGDAEPTDTIVAQWTGKTFVQGIAGEPRAGTPADAPYTVGLFVEGAPAYVDRTHIWVSVSPELPIPSYLIGGEYIMVGNDNKDNANYRLDITVSQPVAVYLLFDTRTPSDTMQWVFDNGWEPVKTGHNPWHDPNQPDMIGIDESADGSVNGYVAIYRKIVQGGTFSTYQCVTPNNMYGVVVTEVPPAGPLQFKSINLTGDGKIRIEWEGIATLQQADEITGPWQDVQGASSPYVVIPEGRRKFFRLKR
ncbi:MAG: hypothetical protein QXT26_07200 [Thermoproteota archaeon]